jgi:hypothetical protein
MTLRFLNRCIAADMRLRAEYIAYATALQYKDQSARFGGQK